MTTPWLSEDGQRAIEIIGTVFVGIDVRLGKYNITIPCRTQKFTGDAWYDDGPIRASIVPIILDHHAEEWLHERGVMTRFHYIPQVWDFVGSSAHPIGKKIGKESETFKDKSQALIAAVLAAEEAT